MPSRAVRRRSTLRLATLGASLGVTVAAAAALNPVAAQASESTATTYLQAINQERAAHGLRPLVERHALNAVAGSWAAHMAAKDTLSHNPRLANVVSNWRALGENVGMGPDIHSLDRAFWNSPEHRANILDSSYREVGIGAVTRDGVIWITVDFRDPMHSTTPPRPVAHRPVRGERWTTARPVRRHHRVLHLGSRGHDVAHVQRRLHVTADGVFGPVTRNAVERFQLRHHHKPTGVVGHRTWRAITG